MSNYHAQAAFHSHSSSFSEHRLLLHIDKSAEVRPRASDSARLLLLRMRSPITEHTSPKILRPELRQEREEIPEEVWELEPEVAKQPNTKCQGRNHSPKLPETPCYPQGAWFLVEVDIEEQATENR